jgi:hypothetical protein
VPAFDGHFLESVDALRRITELETVSTAGALSAYDVRLAALLASMHKPLIASSTETVTPSQAGQNLTLDVVPDAASIQLANRVFGA